MQPHRTNAKATLMLLLFCAVATSCAANHDFTAVQILSSGNCTNPQAGVAQVTLAEVAKLRGGTLVASPKDETGAVYVSIAKKNQRTGGYRLTLQGAHRDADRAEVALMWQTPAKGDMTIQQITHPCVVVGFDGTGLRQVDVSDQTGPIGSLTLE